MSLRTIQINAPSEESAQQFLSLIGATDLYTEDWIEITHAWGKSELPLEKLCQLAISHNIELASVEGIPPHDLHSFLNLVLSTNPTTPSPNPLQQRFGLTWTGEELIYALVRELGTSSHSTVTITKADADTVLRTAESRLQCLFPSSWDFLVLCAQQLRADGEIDFQILDPPSP